MKTTIPPNSVKPAKKSYASVTRLTSKSIRNISDAAYEAKVEANLGRLMDEQIKNFVPGNKEAFYKFLGRI